MPGLLFDAASTKMYLQVESPQISNLLKRKRYKWPLFGLEGNTIRCFVLLVPDFSHKMPPFVGFSDKESLQF